MSPWPRSSPIPPSFVRPRVPAQQIARGIVLSARTMAPLTSDQYLADARRPQARLLRSCAGCTIAIAPRNSAASFNPASMRSHATTERAAHACHATSQNPQDSRIRFSMIHGWLAFEGPALDSLSHKARRRMCPLYIAGLIGPGDRKSVQPMAARLVPGDYDSCTISSLMASGMRRHWRQNC